jgi:hypothetical protein
MKNVLLFIVQSAPYVQKKPYVVLYSMITALLLYNVANALLTSYSSNL